MHVELHTQLGLPKYVRIGKHPVCICSLRLRAFSVVSGYTHIMAVMNEINKKNTNHEGHIT